MTPDEIAGCARDAILGGMMNLVCSRCGADWKSDDGCSAACESAPVMAARIAALEAELLKHTLMWYAERERREAAEAALRQASLCAAWNSGAQEAARTHFAHYKD